MLATQRLQVQDQAPEIQFFIELEVTDWVNLMDFLPGIDNCMADEKAGMGKIILKEKDSQWLLNLQKITDLMEYKGIFFTS